MTQTLFFDSAVVIAQVVGLPEVADRWDDPSALPKMTIGVLAGHLSMAVLTVERYLNLEAPKPDAHFVTSAAEYFQVALESQDYLDGLDSDMQTSVRARSAEVADSGAATVAALVGDTIDRLRVALPPHTAGFEVYGAMAMTTDAYLDTRIVEMVVHLDDLAASLETPVPPMPDDAVSRTVQVLSDLAVARHGGLAVMRGLARPERASSIAAFA